MLGRKLRGVGGVKFRDCDNRLVFLSLSLTAISSISEFIYCYKTLLPRLPTSALTTLWSGWVLSENPAYEVMATYESDSSGGEENDFTETNVLLGYACKDPEDDIISQIGGRPVCSKPSLLRIHLPLGAE